MTAGFLRAPPFPGLPTPIISQPGGLDEVSDSDLDLLKTAQVGGAFWGQGDFGAADGAAIARPCEAASDRSDAADPWTALAGAARLTAHGSDEWVAVAHLLDVPVEVLSAGAYGEPGDTAADGRFRIRQILSRSRWVDPFTGAPASFASTVDVLAFWRRVIVANRAVAAACGMAWWKRDEIRRFLWVPERRLPIAARPGRALALAARSGGALAVWPSRVSPDLIRQAQRRDVAIVRVEDGFIRSAGLGSDLVPPSSIVVDRRGIHFDPAGPSDLEHILATTDFTPALCARAAALRGAILAAGIGKYSAHAPTPAGERKPGRRRVLVAAQVEDDMSVLAGGGGLTSNLELLRRTRAAEPDAEIWFRPHPDIEAGHRKGAVSEDAALLYADRIVREGGMAALLEQVDGVHVLTSLTGFEALLRGRDVTCHGVPFYAGWGLTRDVAAIPDRRRRKLTLDELVAGVLILYPRYLDPVTRLPCPPEVLIDRLARNQAPNRLSAVSWLRRWQGRFMGRWR